jgi:WD40 repeat protein
MLASGGSDRVVRIWDPESGEQRQSLKGHHDSIWSVSFSADGALLASKSKDSTFRLWSTDSWRALLTVAERSNVRFYPPSLSFHPDESVLATLGKQDRVIRVWDLDIDGLLATG